MIKRFFLTSLIALAGFSSQAQYQKKRAVKDAHEEGKYVYTIGNGADWEVSFYLSTDSVKWEQFNIEPSHQRIFRFDNEKVYFKIHTTHSRYVLYKVPGNTTYKIYYNPDTDKFDLLKFEGDTYMDY